MARGLLWNLSYTFARSLDETSFAPGGGGGGGASEILSRPSVVQRAHALAVRQLLGPGNAKDHGARPGEFAVLLARKQDAVAARDDLA